MYIGIGGASRAGKTTLAQQLEEEIKNRTGKTVDVFSLDDFVKSKMAISKVQGEPDWERPNSIKWDNLTRALERSSADVKIVEGLFAYYPASLRSEYNIKIFVDLDRETFLKRRSEDTRWEEEPDWYPEHAWRSYQKYGTIKGEKTEYLQYNGTEEIDVEAIVSKIS